MQEKTSYYLMDEKCSIDIDNKEDLKRANEILKSQVSKTTKGL